MTEAETTLALDALGSFMLVVFLIGIVVGLISIIAMWKIFTKAGQPGWASIIPIYNIYVLIQVAGMQWWFLILMFIPGVNFVATILIYHYLSKSFGKGSGFTIGLIFLPIIFFPILGFGDAKYLGN